MCTLMGECSRPLQAYFLEGEACTICVKMPTAQLNTFNSQLVQSVAEDPRDTEDQL